MALTAEGLFVWFGSTPILKGVYVRVDPGNVTVLFGENGSGKTTLLRAVAGQIPVTSGITIIDELKLAGKSRRRRFKRIAYLPQDSMIPGDLRVGSVASFFGVSERTLKEDDVLGELSRSRVSELSMGERRYLELLCVLALGRPYAILDEPFSRLAPVIGERILERILRAAASGVGVLVTDHYYRLLIPAADRAYFLRESRCREVDCANLAGSLEALRYLPALRSGQGRTA